MALLNSLFDTKTLKELLKSCNEVSKEFYADCMRKNIGENITREMQESYYYFL